MNPALSLSHTKWQSTSMYFVRSWKLGFEAMCIADWLSQKRSEVL